MGSMWAFSDSAHVLHPKAVVIGGSCCTDCSTGALPCHHVGDRRNLSENVQSAALILATEGNVPSR